VHVVEEQAGEGDVSGFQIKIAGRDLNIGDDRYVEILLKLYENKQAWVRHYETMLAGVNTLGITVVIGVLAFVAESGGANGWWYFAIPLLLAVIGLYMNMWCSREIRNLFRQIVFIEEGFQLYDVKGADTFLLDPAYRNSPMSERTIIIFGLAAYAITIIASVVLGAFFALG
jgi:hypothetical protein